MSRLPTNINDPYRNVASYSTLGDVGSNNVSSQQNGNQPSYSSLGEAARPDYFQNQQQPSSTVGQSNYASLGQHNDYWDRRGSNYSASQNYGGQQASAWSQPMSNNPNQQIPVTWNIEQSSHPNAYGGQSTGVPVTWNMEQSNNQQYQPQHNPYVQLGAEQSSQQTYNHPNSYAQLGQPQMYSQSNYASFPPPPPPNGHVNIPQPPKITIPPPPPPPPVHIPAKATKEPSDPPSQTVSKSGSKKRTQSGHQSERKEKKRKEELQPQQQMHPKWHPPKKDDKKSASQLQSTHQEKAKHPKWHPPKKDKPASQQQSVNQDQVKQSNANTNQNNQIQQSHSNNTEESNITESLDANVSAINALSALESKWTAPATAPTTKLSNRQKRRRRQKKKKTGNDAVELIGEWIDVDPDSNGKSNTEQVVIDLTSDEAFPPLSTKATDGKSAEATKAAVEEYSNMSLEQMSKSQLSSYAAVLTRAIDENNATARTAANEARNQSAVYSRSDSKGDEMDISDEDDEVADVMPASVGMPQHAALEVDTPDVNQSQELANSATEKEKCRLRLEELRAKAKLANAKLRLAKKKHALGSGDSAKSPAPENNRAEGTYQEGDMRMMRPPNSSIQDLTAVRMLGSLVVQIGMIPEPRDKVRYVHTVYQESSDSDDESDEEAEDEQPAAAVLVKEAKPAAATGAEALKQKLHLAKLRLELKKKLRVLKKKQTEAASAPESSSSTDIAPQENQPSNSQSFENEARAAAESEVPHVDKAAQIEELRRRQKELKQSNELSNLNNLVQRQREILRVKGAELSESSEQLQSCVGEIKSKQEQLAASEKKIEEMHHRKRIMEGMILRVTEKLMAARRNLKEKQTQQKNSHRT